MITLTKESFLNYLRQQDLDAQIQPKTNQIYVIYKIDGRDFPMFIKINDEGNILQLLIFFPCILSRQSPPEMARLLNLLNKEIDLPGFGMDETSGVVFYRFVIPTVDGEIAREIVDKLIASLPRVAKIFFPVIASVAQGSSFEKMLGQVKDVLLKSKA